MFNQVTMGSLKSISQYLLTIEDAMHLIEFYGQKASGRRHFKVKFEQTSLFLEFLKLLLYGNCHTKFDKISRSIW